MAQTNQGDYLNDLPYLTQAPYMGGIAEVTTGMQVEMVINATKQTGMQSLMQIVDADKQTGMQSSMITGDSAIVGTQAEMFVAASKLTGMQTDMVTGSSVNTGMQVDQKIVSPDDDLSVGMQAKMGFPAHIICGGYLNDDPYLSKLPYMAERLCALQGMQVSMQVAETPVTGMQVEMSIISPDDDKITGMQVVQQIAGNSKITGMQADMVAQQQTGMQASMQLYSVDTLRILCSFPSRGTPAQGGLSWTSVQALRTGDFDANNLNTDIFEERTETLATPPATWELRCDTGLSNTFVDTIYIGEHNFTLGATVEFQASDDPAFGTIKYTRNMTVEEQHMYFILPLIDFPPEPARYFRFTIQDVNNPGSLKIGIIVFGSAVTFSQRERFLNPVRFGFNHFKDTIETEGFTNVSNDRALRKFLGLSFEQLRFDGGNFEKLRDYFLESKTDLKCLIIPRPTRPSSLAVFAKMKQIPEEQHYATSDDNHRIDLSIDWDEAD